MNLIRFFLVGCIIHTALLQIEAQNIMLGKTTEFIIAHYTNDPEFTMHIDTLNNRRLLINCRSTAEVYPHHTFEIDRLLDRCITYGFVSRNPDVLNTYIEILEHAGSLVMADDDFSEFTYLLDLPDKHIYYTFKRPFLDNPLRSKRNIYYMVITEERKRLQVGN